MFRIMKHFWINIDKSVIRREYMHSQFEKNNIENVRVSAYTPDDFEEVLNHKRPLSCGHCGCNSCEYEYACLCSHIKAMQEGIKSGDEYFIIMEDDIFLPFIIDYNQLVNDIPTDTEILQMMVLYGPTVENLYKYYLSTKNKYFKWKYLLPSTGMYMISRKGAMRMVSLFFDEESQKYDFSSSPFQKVADVILYETALTYVTTVPYAYPNVDIISEIHPDHAIAHRCAATSMSEIVATHDTHPFPFILKRC